MLIGVFAAVGAMFGALAGLTAFLITFAEYRRHGMDARRCWREGLGSAAVAFVFFLVACLVLGFAFSWFLQRESIQA